MVYAEINLERALTPFKRKRIKGVRQTGSNEEVVQAFVNGNYLRNSGKTLISEGGKLWSPQEINTGEFGRYYRKLVIIAYKKDDVFFIKDTRHHHWGHTYAMGRRHKELLRRYLNRHKLPRIYLPPEQNGDSYYGGGAFPRWREYDMPKSKSLLVKYKLKRPTEWDDVWRYNRH